MSISRVVLPAAFLLAALPALAAPSCLTPAEQRAGLLRQMHQDMQVAALKCPELGAAHREYLRRFGPVLADNARTLKEHFTRNAGGEGQRLFDRYLTRLANKASRASQHQADYCEAEAALFETALRLKPAQLEAFAGKMIDDFEEFGACPKPRR